MIIWVVFQTLGGPLLFIGGVLGLLLWFVLALFAGSWTALIPVAIAVLAIAWAVRRDRQAAAKLIAERDGIAPRGPRRPGL